MDAVRSGAIVFDGATGANLQLLSLDADSFGGAAYEGCYEMLNLTRVVQVAVADLAEGWESRPCWSRWRRRRPDIVADLHRSFLDVTFGAFAVPLGEYRIADPRLRDRRRRDAYEVAASSLIDGGAARFQSAGTAFLRDVQRHGCWRSRRSTVQLTRDHASP